MESKEARHRAILSNRKQPQDNKGYRARHGHKPPNPLTGLDTPCYNFSVCKNMATLSKQGKGVCRPCADKMQGVEYLYQTPRTDMVGSIHWHLIVQAARPAV